MQKIRLAAFSDEADSSILGQIQALKRNGLNLTELRTVEGKNVSILTEEESKEYKKIFDDNGVNVWSIGSPLGKVDINVDFKAYSETIKKVCNTANVFDTKRIRMFSFFNAYENRNKVIDYLSQMVEIANEYGVYMCHENEKEIYGDNLERVQDIMNSVKGLKFVYDPANYLQVGEMADNTLDALHDKTDYFHIKDVISQTGELVPAGYGDGKIEKLIEMINSDKVLTLEPHLAVFAAFKDIDNTQMKHKFKFFSSADAFDCAIKSLKDLLIKAGYQEKDGAFIK